MKKALPPLNYLQNFTSLTQIFEKVQMLNEINARIDTFLPENLRTYCQVANILNGRLIFIAANSSIATSIRLESYNLLEKFKKDPVLKGVRSIHSRVATPRMKKATKPLKKMQNLSQETASIIQTIADTISDPKLKAIMLKIASHGKKTD